MKKECKDSEDFEFSIYNPKNGKLLWKKRKNVKETRMKEK